MRCKARGEWGDELERRARDPGGRGYILFFVFKSQVKFVFKKTPASTIRVEQEPAPAQQLLPLRVEHHQARVLVDLRKRSLVRRYEGREGRRGGIEGRDLGPGELPVERAEVLLRLPERPQWLRRCAAALFIVARGSVYVKLGPRAP